MFLQNALGGLNKLYDQQEYRNCVAHPNRWMAAWQNQIISNANIPALITKMVQMIRKKTSSSGAMGDGEDTAPFTQDANQLAVSNVRLVFAKQFTIPIPIYAKRIPDTENKGTWEFSWVFDNEFPKKSNVELYSGDYSTLVPVLKSRSFMCDDKGQPVIDVVYSDLKWGVFDRVEDDAPDNAEKVNFIFVSCSIMNPICISDTLRLAFEIAV